MTNLGSSNGFLGGSCFYIADNWGIARLFLSITCGDVAFFQAHTIQAKAAGLLIRMVVFFTCTSSIKICLHIDLLRLADSPVVLKLNGSDEG